LSATIKQQLKENQGRVIRIGVRKLATSLENKERLPFQENDAPSSWLPSRYMKASMVEDWETAW